jgi:hypothetical protein
MRYLEAIGDLLLFAIVLAIFAPIYYTIKLIDWIKGKIK